MKSIHTQTLTIIFFVLNLFANGIHAQVDWKEGFFVKNDGSKVDCLIKNRDWKNNPVSFDYKLSASEKPKTATIEEVTSFVINNAGKYIRDTVLIDLSSDQIGQLSRNSKPEFKKQTVFLKVLVEGAANLYEYENNNLRRFFYSSSDSVEPLIYKRYNIEGDKIGRNNKFQQQLWKHIRCEGLHMTEVLELLYKKKELINFFIDYNKCKNSLYTIYNTISGKRTHINLNIGSGFGQLTIVLKDIFYDHEDKLPTNTYYNMGVELEHYLPFNNKKWSLFLGPSLTYFKARGEYISSFGSHHEVMVNNLSLDILSGFRHRFNLSEGHQLFITAGILSYLPLNGFFKVDRIGEFSFSYYNSFFIGTGFRFKGQYSIGINYNFGRSIIQPENYIVNYSHIGVQIGCRLIKF